MAGDNSLCTDMMLEVHRVLRVRARLHIDEIARSKPEATPEGRGTVTV
jgi:hypothetical protein